MQKAGAKVDILVMDQSWKSSKEKRLNYIQFYKDVFFFKNYQHYDLVYINHFPHIFPSLVPNLRKIKAGLIHWHGSEIYAANKQSRILNRISHKLIPKKFRHITPSGYFAGCVANELGIEKSSIMVSPSGGVDTDIFVPRPEPKDSKQITLGFTSAIDHGKGGDLLVALVKELPRLEKQFEKTIRLKLIRYGSGKEKYLGQMEGSGYLDVIDPIAKETMPELYNSFDILLFPTRRKAESLGLVALEAMACGVPVVGSNDFAIQDYVISGQTGETFTTGVAAEFVQAVESCISQLNTYDPRKMVMTDYSKQSVVGFYKQMFKEYID